MEWEPPDLPEEAVYRILSGESRQFLKYSFQVTAINLASACLDQADWRASLLVFTKDECVTPRYSEASETKQPPAASCREPCRKGEAVGHQYVNKLPHSVNQTVKLGQ